MKRTKVAYVRWTSIAKTGCHREFCYSSKMVLRLGLQINRVNATINAIKD